MNETPSARRHWDASHSVIEALFALAFFSPLAKRLSPQPGSNAYKTLNLRRNWYTKPMWRRIGSPNEMFSPSISQLNAQPNAHSQVGVLATTINSRKRKNDQSPLQRRGEQRRCSGEQASSQENIIPPKMGPCIGRHRRCNCRERRPPRPQRRKDPCVK